MEVVGTQNQLCEHSKNVSIFFKGINTAR